MNRVLMTVIAAVAGLIIGFCLTYIFRILPEKWLQDYGYDEKAPDFRPSKRMKAVPHGILAAAACSLFYALAVFFCYDLYIARFAPLHLAVILLSVPVIILVAAADRLNRIIPDEFPLFFLILGIIGTVGDLTEGSIWFSQDATVLNIILNRVIAMAAGGLGLWLIGFIFTTFMGKEAMGQGDMKLLGSCGLMVGCYGLVVLIYVAVFTAVLFAVPLLIKKRIRINKEEEEIRNSPDPVKARRELRKRKAQIHFADDPDYLAFGPFLAVGAGVFLCLEPVFAERLLPFAASLGVAF